MAGKTGVETSLHRARVDARDAELIFNLALADGLRSKWAGSRLGEGGEAK